MANPIKNCETDHYGNIMKKYIHKEELAYTGAELSSHFAFRNFGVVGDSIVSFTGPADVRPDMLVDLVDAKEKAIIFSQKMLHFIVEIFDLNLEKAILIQRLLISIISQRINEKTGKLLLTRKNDDIFVGNKKLSVSVATLSGVSSLIHIGLNITTANTPVETAGLEELGVDATEFAGEVCDLFIEELRSISIARSKVKGVD